MDLNRVAIFARVVVDGGMSAAARTLRVPKSTVSRAVSLLEEELGVRLLQRSTRKMSLTDAGTAFFERASRGLTGLEEAAAAVVDMQGALRGPIKITAPADAGAWLLGPLITRFVQLNPGVLIDAVLTARLVDLVEEGFDLALRAGQLRDSTLVARKLGAVDPGLFASPAYLARKGTPTTVPELSRHECVLFRAPGGHATWSLVGPAGEESVDVTGAIVGDDFLFIHRLLVLGGGVGLLPAFLGAAECASGALVRVLPRHCLRGGPLHLVYPSTRYLPQRVVSFRDFILGELGEKK
jgi:DNA-binding transcriptional LysR family regulator